MADTGDHPLSRSNQLPWPTPQAARLLLMAEAAHLERLARNATHEASNIAENNERIMSELTEMIQVRNV